MSLTIAELIATITAAVPGAPFDGSVDTIKSGDPTRPVSGVVTTFTATLPVLRQAVAQRANLIITHEPTFYDHRDTIAWLSDDPIYAAKRAYIDQHHLTIWRFHDYWHLLKPDGIITGMLQALGWQSALDPENGYLLHLPDRTALDVAAHLKRVLGLSHLRLAGDPHTRCARLGLLVGSMGGEMQITSFHHAHLDAIICGETVEWQVCEYVRDAAASGQPRALLILGHANSEEQGMRYLVDWLQPRFPTIPISFIAAGDPITLV